MNRAQKVRDYLNENASPESPKTMLQIRTDLGLTTKQLHSSICEMIKEGMVQSSGAIRSRGYWITPGRNVRSHILSGLCRREAERQRSERRRRRNGAMPREERKQANAEARAERQRMSAMDRALAAVERMKTQEQAKQQKAARKATPNPQPKIKHQPSKPAMRKAPPVIDMTQPVEPYVAPNAGRNVSADVEAWLAAGNKPEILQLGQVSNPLRFIGDGATHRQRERNKQRRASA